MDLNELWIGDVVEILSSGKTGKFEGIAPDGKAKIKIGKEYLMVIANDLALYVEEKPKKKGIQYDQYDEFKEDLKKEKKVEKPVEAFYFNEPSAEVEEEEEFDLDKSLEFRRTIDLHIEHYADYNPRMWVNGELGFQVYKCKKYLNMAIALRIQRVEIIYGVGQGILKKHILDLLKDYQEVDRISEVNSGASEVWFLY